MLCMRYFSGGVVVRLWYCGRVACHVRVVMWCCWLCVCSIVVEWMVVCKVLW